MSKKQLNENEIGNISSGIGSLNATLFVGSVAASAVGTINFWRRFAKSDKKGFWDKYKDAVGPSTVIPNVVGATLGVLLEHLVNNSD